MSDEIMMNFLAMTGCEDHDLCTTLLDSTGWDLQRSVQCYWDMQGSAQPASADRPPVSTSQPSAPVRAPIPSSRQVLMESDAFVGLPTQPPPPNPFSAAFRDFAAEGDVPPGPRNAAAAAHADRLAKMFAPPTDIALVGRLDDALATCRQVGSFLLVNLQDIREFASQALNRDVWSDERVRALLGRNAPLQLWQVDGTSSAGQEFASFYKVTSFPYIALLDPRTGECLEKWTGAVDAGELVRSLTTLLAQQDAARAPSSSSASSTGSTATRGTSAMNAISLLDDDDDDYADYAFDEDEEVVEEPSIIDASEDAQLAAAIAASLAQSRGTGDGDDDARAEQKKRPRVSERAMDTGDEPEAAAAPASEAGPPPALQTPEEVSASEVQLQVRFPNGTSLKCGFARDATLATVRRYLATHGSDEIGSADQVCLSLSFPRKELPHSDDGLCLSEIPELGKRATLFASHEP